MAKGMSMMKHLLLLLLIFGVAWAAEEKNATAETEEDEGDTKAEVHQWIRGFLWERGDELGYDKAYESLLWNADPSIDNDPLFIAQCAGPTDVKLSMTLAEEMKLPISVRSGGLHPKGLGSNKDGLVMDLRLMKFAHVDAKDNTMWVDSGNTLKELHLASIPEYGLAPVTGTIGCTGLGGLATGGGFSYLGRKYGFAVDNILEVEMVTPDFRDIVASPTENKDLFWAIRGGGSSFGVITAFKLQLHPVPQEVFGGSYFVEEKHCMDLIKNQGTFYDDAAPEANSIVTIMTDPDYPEAGTKCMNTAIFLGEPREGRRALRKLRDATPIESDTMGTVPLVEFLHSQDAEFCSTDKGQYWESVPFLKNKLFSPEGLAMIEEIKANRPATAMIVLEPWMGVDQAGRALTAEAGREPSTAFMARFTEFQLKLIGTFAPEDSAQREAVVTWVKESKEKATKLGLPRHFSGYSSGGRFDIENLRLRDIKTEYDPDNLFKTSELTILPFNEEEMKLYFEDEPEEGDEDTTGDEL